MTQNIDIPHGYKDSPLGIIPQGWEVRRLGEITKKIGSGVTPKGGEAVYQEQGRYFIRSQNVGWGHLLLDDVAFIDDATHNRQIATELQDKDILLNITGASIGRSTIVTNEIVGGNVNQHVCIIRLKNGVEAHFVCSYLLSDIGQRLIDSYQAGGNRQGLNFEQIKSFIIPLPPLEEQERIAEVLGCWDEAIERQGRMVALLTTRKRALMQQLLTPQPHWQKTKLGEIGKTYNGLTGKTKEDFGVGDAYYIPYVNVFNNAKTDINVVEKVALSDGEKQNSVNCGDLFFTVSSETPGEVGMSSVLLYEMKETYLNSFCFGYRLNDFKTLLPYFAVYYLRSDAFRRAMYIIAQGSTRFNISKFVVLEWELNLPPLAEQKSIAEKLSTADAEIDLARRRLDLLRTQKRALMQQLLTGKKQLKILTK